MTDIKPNPSKCNTKISTKQSELMKSEWNRAQYDQTKKIEFFWKIQKVLLKNSRRNEEEIHTRPGTRSEPPV